MKLNLKEVPKKILDLEFLDNTQIKVTMPTKEMFEELELFKENESPSVAELYSTLAMLLSRNIEQVTITREYLAKALDFEDVMNLYKGYLQFVNEGTSNPN